MCQQIADLHQICQQKLGGGNLPADLLTFTKSVSRNWGGGRNLLEDLMSSNLLAGMERGTSPGRFIKSASLRKFFSYDWQASEYRGFTKDQLFWFSLQSVSSGFAVSFSSY